MIVYIVKRILYAIPILIGVNLITFLLFFTVNSPADIARSQLGGKYVTPEMLQRWEVQAGYNLPLFYNDKDAGLKKITRTIFYKKSVSLFLFDFGQSNQGRSISGDISERMWPSLALAVPTLFVGLFIYIVLSLLVTLFKNTMFDTYSIAFCVILMSISGMFYIIVGQYYFGKLLKWVPISGYQGGFDAIKFLVLPAFVGIVMGMGSDVRWYRTIFLEEMNKSYVQTARSKGLSVVIVLFKHVFKNGLIPILTGVVVIIPSLFLGSLIMESFFGIPGLGSYTIDAIQQQDFEIVRVMVFLGTLFYIFGLILTDISYTLVDPRIRFRGDD